MVPRMSRGPKRVVRSDPGNVAAVAPSEASAASRRLMLWGSLECTISKIERINRHAFEHRGDTSDDDEFHLITVELQENRRGSRPGDSGHAPPLRQSMKSWSTSSRSAGA